MHMYICTMHTAFVTGQSRRPLFHRVIKSYCIINITVIAHISHSQVYTLHWIRAFEVATLKCLCFNNTIYKNKNKILNRLHPTSKVPSQDNRLHTSGRALMQRNHNVIRQSCFHKHDVIRFAVLRHCMARVTINTDVIQTFNSCRSAIRTMSNWRWFNCWVSHTISAQTLSWLTAT